MLSKFTSLVVYSYLPWKVWLVKISKLSTRQRLLLPSSHLLGSPRIQIDLVECDIASVHYLIHLTNDIELKFNAQNQNSATIPQITALFSFLRRQDVDSPTLFLHNAKSSDSSACLARIKLVKSKRLSILITVDIRFGAYNCVGIDAIA